jgi:hypothetical protein
MLRSLVEALRNGSRKPEDSFHAAESDRQEEFKKFCLRLLVVQQVLIDNGVKMRIGPVTGQFGEHEKVHLILEVPTDPTVVEHVIDTLEAKGIKILNRIEDPLLFLMEIGLSENFGLPGSVADFDEDHDGQPIQSLTIWVTDQEAELANFLSDWPNFTPLSKSWMD